MNIRYGFEHICCIFQCLHHIAARAAGAADCVFKLEHCREPQINLIAAASTVLAAAGGRPAARSARAFTRQNIHFLIDETVFRRNFQDKLFFSFTLS